MRILEMIEFLFGKKKYSSYPPPALDDDVDAQFHQAQMERLRAATQARREINEKLLEVDVVLRVVVK